MKIEWNFPNNGCGQIRGIEDAVIEKSPESVVVEFNRYTISSDNIPGYREYLKSLLKAYKYWQTRKSEKTITYLEKAIKALEAPTTYVLKIVNKGK